MKCEAKHGAGASTERNQFLRRAEAPRYDISSYAAGSGGRDSRAADGSSVTVTHHRRRINREGGLEFHGVPLIPEVLAATISAAAKVAELVDAQAGGAGVSPDHVSRTCSSTGSLTVS